MHRFGLPALSSAFERRLLLVSGLFLSFAACSTEGTPGSLQPTPEGLGPTVRVERRNFTLADVPLPSDLLTLPDRSSRTGRRLNFGTSAPTELERNLYRDLVALEGWGTSAPIVVAFDKHDGSAEAAIDLEQVQTRHQRDDYEPADDVMYLVDLETGEPVPLELGAGSFSPILADKAFLPNDPRESEPTLFFETRDETLIPGSTEFDPARTQDGTPLGAALYSPEWDTDFDGVLDRPNLTSLTRCTSNTVSGQGGSDRSTDDLLEEADSARDRCLADGLLTWYDRETDRLIARPMIALRELHEYAVVLTDRLRSPRGQVVRSPFESVYHPLQRSSIERLRAHLEDPALSAYYGDLGGTGLSRIAFAWTFTTGPGTSGLAELRAGLDGTGRLAVLSERFPARAEALTLGPSEGEPARCANRPESLLFVSAEEVLAPLVELARLALGLDELQAEALRDDLSSISHFGVLKTLAPGIGDSPDDPLKLALGSRASLSADGMQGRQVNLVIAVPQTTDSARQPFPVAVWNHRFGGSWIEMLERAGALARSGIASVAFNADLHGIPLEESVAEKLSLAFEEACAARFFEAILKSTAVDADGDAVPDPGAGSFSQGWSSLRDLLLRTSLETLHALRVLGQAERASASSLEGSDFDASGTPDVTTSDVFLWGESLGGHVAALVAAFDPLVTAAAPIAAGAGLVPWALTEEATGVKAATLAPLVVGEPASTLQASDPELELSCADDELLISLMNPLGTRVQRVPLLCLEAARLSRGGTVLVTNVENRERRCARIDPGGRFRVTAPATRHDPLEIQIYDAPDITESYAPGACVLDTTGSERVALIQEFGFDSLFGTERIRRGAPLRAPSGGLGLIRQTPHFRLWLELATHVLDAVDPLSAAARFAPRAGSGPASALVNVAVAGDRNVGASFALARAAGVLPFLRPDAETRYPGWRDYVTPRSWFNELGSVTPHRLLITRHAIEGVARLARHVPNQCGQNELDDESCHASCSDESACRPGQACINGRCALPLPSQSECSHALFDIDAFDAGRSRSGELESPTPLRAARLARSASGRSLDAIWRPLALGGRRWSASTRIAAHATAYVSPLGAGSLGPIDPCSAWSESRYITELVARFFASGGQDLLYLSHPLDHQCLAYPAERCPD